MSELKGKVKQTLRTAETDGELVPVIVDDLGRQVFRPVQVRDLIRTAFATSTNITETSLLAGVAGEFHDPLWIVGSNSSDAAITLAFKATTGGSTQFSLRIPANSISTFAPSTPIPQDHSGSSWTVTNSATDDSTTTYSVTANFSVEA